MFYISRLLKYLILPGILLSIFDSTGFADRKAEPFLAPHLMKLIERSKQIDASPLLEMWLTPRAIEPGMPDFYHTLTEGQHKSLVGYLAAAKELDPTARLKECKYLPGVQLTFHSEKWPAGDTVAYNRSSTLRVLLCFNCDVWAIAQSDRTHLFNGPETVIAYGDSRPFRKELLKLMKAIDPSLSPLPDN